MMKTEIDAGGVNQDSGNFGDFEHFGIEKDKEKEELMHKANLFGCDITEEQALFFIAQLEKEFVFDSYLCEHGLEFVNERTKKSVSDDFDLIIFAPENKDRDFKEVLHSLVTDENGGFLWDLFDLNSRKKHNLTVYGDDEINYVDISKILPPQGSFDSISEINPFEKEHWNMEKQAQLYRENPEIAKYLAAAAKQKIM